MKTTHSNNEYIESVTSIIELLNAIRASPDTSFESLTPLFHFKSQGNLCKLSIPEKRIIPSSLNTFKLYCSRTAPGGFEAVDALRASVYILVKKEAEKQLRPPRSTQKEIIANLRKESAQLNIDLLAITKLLLISMKQSAFYADRCNDTTIMELYRKEHKELLDMMTRVRSDIS